MGRLKSNRVTSPCRLHVHRLCVCQDGTHASRVNALTCMLSCLHIRDRGDDSGRKPRHRWQCVRDEAACTVNKVVGDKYIVICKVKLWVKDASALGLKSARDLP